MRFAKCTERPALLGRRVAVVGAGPAGLAAAGYLACLGYEVDVFDKLPLPGGLLVFAIPPWRLPRQRVFDGVKELEERLSVEFLLRTKVVGGGDRKDEGDKFAERTVQLEDLIGEYDAVFVATGAWSSKVPRIPGVEAEGVETVLEYLLEHRAFELGFSSASPLRARRVVVVGGGYSAMDAAEQALRDGSEVHLVYRRTAIEPYMVEGLRQAGVNFVELAAPVEVLVENSRARGLRLQRMRLGELDETKRPRPVPVPGSEFTIEADLVVFATGEAPTPPVVAAEDYLKRVGLSLGSDGRIVINELFQTGNPKVFAAGDVVTGPSKIGPAMVGGVGAAKSLHEWLSRAAAGLGHPVRVSGSPSLARLV